MVDEGLENYLEIDKWMRGLGFPETFNKFMIYKKMMLQIYRIGMNIYSDGTLTIYNNQSQPSRFVVKFRMYSHTT